MSHCRSVWNSHSTPAGTSRALDTAGHSQSSLQQDIRVSLIFSMLQQMLAEDKCDQVRAVCSKSLGMVINEIDDESRLFPVCASRLLAEERWVMFVL